MISAHHNAATEAAAATPGCAARAHAHVVGAVTVARNEVPCPLQLVVDNEDAREEQPARVRPARPRVSERPMMMHDE